MRPSREIAIDPIRNHCGYYDRFNMTVYPLDARARLFHTESGAHLEFTTVPESAESSCVYRVDLSKDVSVQFAHLIVDQVQTKLTNISARYGLWTSQERTWETFFVGTAVAADSWEVWLKRAKGTLLQRVQCVLDLAVVLGADALGLEQMDLLKSQLRERWFPKIEPGPVTTLHAPQQTTINELLFLLRTVNPDAFSHTFTYFQELQPHEWAEHGDKYEYRVVQHINFAIAPEHRLVFRFGQYTIEKE